MEFNLTFGQQNLLEMFGDTDSSICTAYCMEDLATEDMSFRFLEGKERDTQILEQLKRIERDTQIVGTPERTIVWQNGWNENLQEYRESGYNLETLRPKFFREGIPLRYQQEFIQTRNPLFEYHLQRAIKRFIFERYLSQYDHIHEFGCGTGYNLADFAMHAPDKHFYGYDFVPSSIDLLQAINQHAGTSIQGHLFNIKEPDFSVSFAPSSVVCTFACLEQLSEDTDRFLDFLMEKKPDLCVHLEPIVELYDDSCLIDYLAKKFHTKRHYLSGFYPHLLKLEQANKIQLIKTKRLFFGNYNHESSTLIVWKPL